MGTMMTTWATTTPEQKEWNEARTAYYQAQQNFNYATGEYIDVAIEDLQIAEKRMDNALRKLDMRKGGVCA